MHMMPSEELRLVEFCGTGRAVFHQRSQGAVDCREWLAHDQGQSSVVDEEYLGQGVQDARA